MYQLCHPYLHSLTSHHHDKGLLTDELKDALVEHDAMYTLCITCANFILVKTISLECTSNKDIYRCTMIYYTVYKYKP